MKDTLNATYKSKDRLLKRWQQFSYLVGREEQDDRTIKLEEEAIKEIEELLPFKNEEEHQHWLDVLQGYKFWEDLEELTMGIIKRATSPNKVKDELLLAYNQVALDVCEDSNFYDLFNVFSQLSHHWVDTIDGWNDWWEKLSKDEKDVQFFLEVYKDIYGKDLEKKDVFKFYGFETCNHPMFYKNDIEGKSDLIDCIFERYVSGLNEDEELWFYQRLIKELI